MNFVVFGGRSPIAISISKSLAESGHEVTHITRSNSDQIKNIFAGFKINILEINLENEINSLEVWTKLLNSKLIDGVVFAQRYRGAQDDIKSMFQCDVITPYSMMKEYCSRESPRIKKVLILTSPAAHRIIKEQGFPYHATKAALLHLVKYLAAGSLGNVLANAISPASYVLKERNESFYKTNHNYFKLLSENIPSGSFSEVDDISLAAKFLLLNASSSFNGMEIVIDGGLSIIDQSNLMNRFINLDSKF